VIENIVLGIEPTRGLFLDTGAATARATAVLAELGITLPLDRRRGASRLPNSSSPKSRRRSCATRA